MIAARVHLTDVAGLLRDAVAASGKRAERLAELTREIAQAGHLHAPARLLAAMEVHANRYGVAPESAVRTTDVANRRIVVVQPEQTAVATANASNLGLHLTSLTAVLETIPLGRQSLAVIEPASGVQSAVREARPARPTLTNIQFDRNATVTQADWRSAHAGHVATLLVKAYLLDESSASSRALDAAPSTVSLDYHARDELHI